MQVGDKVRVNCKYSIYHNRIGTIKSIHDYDEVSVLLDNDSIGFLFPSKYLEPLEPKFILELTQDEWQAFRDLLKMKANLELLENLEKRIK